MKLRPELLNVVCNMDILLHSEGKRTGWKNKRERERGGEGRREGEKRKNNKWEEMGEGGGRRRK